MRKVDSLVRHYITAVIMVFLAIFHIVSGIWGMPDTNAFRHIHLELMLVVCFLLKPGIKQNAKISFIVDMVFSLISLSTLAYVLSGLKAFTMRQGSPSSLDVLFGSLFILCVLEGARRVAGIPMVLIAVFFFGQNLVANYMPGIFRGNPVAFSNMIDFTFMRSTGIFGLPLQTISSYVILFMIFAALLGESGAGTFFIDLATAMTGKYRGGPAKAAVVASAGFGSISGSAVANVAGTGCMTIPLMKEVGYDAKFAGAVEAVASTGGQIMPPMMGATAFIIAQNVGLSYFELALDVCLIAILYFVAVFFMVDLRAGKMGLKGTPKEKIPDFWKTLKDGGHLVIPIILIVYLLAVGKSAQYASMFSTIALVLVCGLRKWTRMDGRRILRGICAGVRDTASVSVTAACAGIIIGGIQQAGLGVIFAYSISKICAGNLALALVLVAVASLVLGMGMTTTAVYITVATIMAPALTNMGVDLVAAHMFCFFFGVISVITPPVALASFTAAGISGAKPSETGWESVRIGIAAFLIPFIFVYNPVLLLQGGTIPEVIIAVVTALLGCWTLAASVQGFALINCNLTERIFLFAMAMCCIIPGIITDMIGVVGLLLVLSRQKLALNKEQKERLA